jgi:hypothetical protein
LAFRDEKGSLSTKGFTSYEIAEDGSPAGGSGGSQAAGDSSLSADAENEDGSDDVAVKLDYGDVELGAAEDLKLVGDQPIGAELDESDGGGMSADLDLDLAGLEGPESPMSPPGVGRDLESSDLMFSGDLEGDEVEPQDEEAVRATLDMEYLKIIYINEYS